MVTEGNLMANLLRKKVEKDDPVSKVLYKRFKKVPTTATLAELSRILDTAPYVLVVSNQRCCEFLEGSAPYTVGTKDIKAARLHP